MYSQPNSGLLGALNQWNATTVPVAIMILLFHVIGISALQAQDRGTGSVHIYQADLPAPPSLGTPGLGDGADGSMTPLQPGMPTVINTAPVPGNLAVSPERQAEVMTKARAEQHHFRAKGGGAAAVHPGLGIDLGYNAAGMNIRPQGGDGLLAPASNWSVRFSLAEIKIDGEALEVSDETSSVVLARDRASRVVARDATEWWVNSEAGPEHGFTIESSPRPTPRNLEISLTLAGNLNAFQEDGTILFKDGDGRIRMSYGELHVEDATGRMLPSRMELHETEGDWKLSLEAELADAVFPITVDPVVGTQQEEALAGDGLPGDEFGFASDGIGDVMAVSSPGKLSGKVYLFHENQGGAGAWDEKTSVVIPVTEIPVVGDRFGQSVAVFEDEGAGKTYLAVGAPQHDGTGSVFVYERNQGAADNWGFVQILQDVELSGGDGFGTAVDGLGNTLAIGAPNHGAGAVFIFEVDAGNFSRVQKITTPPGQIPAAGDEFGAAVALGGDHMVIGAPGENSENGGAYLFKRGSPYAVLFRLFTDKSEAGARFGAVVAIAITGLLLAVGMPFDDLTFGPTLVDAGSVFIYAFLATTLAWGFLTAMFGSAAGDLFGSALALNFFFDLAVGAPGARSTASVVGGAVFIFLFSQFLFSYDAGSKIVPSSFIDPGMALGTSVVLLGRALFILGAAYSFFMGAMFRFTLAATVLTFALWQQLFWTQDQIDNRPDITGFHADPDLDGLVNGLEFAMLLIPILFTPPSALGFRLVNGNFQFEFQQSLVAVGVLLLIQYALALNLWHLLGAGPQGGNFSVKVLHSGIQAQRIRVTFSSLLVLALFMRLSVESTLPRLE